MSALHENAAAVLSWLEDTKAKPFHKWVLDFYEIELRKLLSSSDEVELYRAQGRLEVLNQLRTLQQDMDSHLHRMGPFNTQKSGR